MGCVRPHYLLRWLLILGLLLGSTSVSIHHAHERHGLAQSSGFARLSSSVEQRSCPHLWHTHLLLLGVECCEWEGVFFPPGMTVGLGADVPDPSGARAMPLDSSAVALPSQSATAWLVEAIPPFSSRCTSRASARVLLCDQARGARSGVRLA
jgi:hypothetical protein